MPSARGLGRSFVPVVALSASCSDEEKLRCRASGMVAFLSKPMKIEMIGILHAILDEAANRKLAGAAGAVATGPRTTSFSGWPGSWPEVKHNQ